MNFFLHLKWFFLKKKYQYFLFILLLTIYCTLQIFPPKLIGLFIDFLNINKFSIKLAIIWLFIMFTISFLIYFINYLWRILLFKSSYELSIILRKRFYNLLVKQSLCFFFKYKQSDLIIRVINDVDKIVYATGEGILYLFSSIFKIVLIFFIMIFQINWFFVIVFISPMFLMVYIIQKYNNTLRMLYISLQKTFLKLNDQVQENISVFKIIKSFGVELFFLNKFRYFSNKNNYKNIYLSCIDAKLEPIIYLMISLSNLFALLSCSWLFIKKKISIGQLTSCFLYLELLILPILSLSIIFNIIQQGNIAYIRYNNIIWEKNNFKQRKKLFFNKKNFLKIYIKSFSYPNSFIKSLKNIYFNLISHKTLGICGPTGSGKSTLLFLILRYFEDFNGKITFNNIPIQDISISEWRKKIGIINQIPFIFSDTILYNVSMNNINIEFNKIIKATKISCIYNDIIKFPKQYQTKIGTQGVILSGGQKQKISIARTILLNPKFLIIDDALSNFDIKTANKILFNLWKWKKNNSIILVSNNLSFLKEFDNIIVIKNGKILEKGNHIDLLNNKKWYYENFINQCKKFI